MADMSFDAVIIGGGNKALVTAMYLTKYGGLSVGMFEERHELGGGWSTEEPAPGFMANTCSHGHFANYHLPVYEDFPMWKEYGARYMHNKVAVGITYIEDDSCVLIYNAFDDVDPTQEQTAQSIARFSQRDADTWLRLWEKCQKYWRPALDEWHFTPAQPLDVPDALDRLIQNPDAGIDTYWATLSPLQVYKELFESIEMQHAFARVNQSWGIQPDQAGSGLGAVVFLMYVNNFHWGVIGGTHQLAHASQRVILENGGKVFTRHGVEKILIENGKAKGIRLKDGTEIEAKKLVVSSVDPYQLCFELIGKDYLPLQIVRRVENIERHWVCITWYTWALREKPRYRAEAMNPDVNECAWLVFGDKDLKTMVVESAERKMGKWPSKLNMLAGYRGGSPDDLLAPANVGNFNVITEVFVPPADAYPEKEWKRLEKWHAEQLIEKWSEYSYNMSWDNVIAYNPVTPFYTANMAKNYAPAGNWAVIDHIPSQMGKYRPIPDLAGHKMPVQNLYATGTAWHPYAAGFSCQGYNCYKVIAEDLNLGKPWKDKGRPY